MYSTLNRSVIDTIDSIIYRTVYKGIVSSKTHDQVVKALTREPQTPNEIARTTGYNQKTVQTILLEEYGVNKRIRLKKAGRIRLFWKEEEERGE